jgi:hypothetical protein
MEDFARKLPLLEEKYQKEMAELNVFFTVCTANFITISRPKMLN